MAGTRNVLIVEDEPMLRDLYQQALVQSDYVVHVAGTAEQTYQVLANFKPDYIFLDIMLPSKSGLDLLPELRTNPALNCVDAKIIVLSNLAQHSVVDSALQNGADSYIVKADIMPFELPDIIKSVDE